MITTFDAGLGLDIPHEVVFVRDVQEKDAGPAERLSGVIEFLGFFAPAAGQGHGHIRTCTSARELWGRGGTFHARGAFVFGNP